MAADMPERAAAAVGPEPFATDRLDLLPLRVEHAEEMAAALAGRATASTGHRGRLHVR